MSLLLVHYSRELPGTSLFFLLPCVVWKFWCLSWIKIKIHNQYDCILFLLSSIWWSCKISYVCLIQQMTIKPSVVTTFLAQNNRNAGPVVTLMPHKSWSLMLSPVSDCKTGKYNSQWMCHVIENLSFIIWIKFLLDTPLCVFCNGPLYSVIRKARFIAYYNK